MNIIYHSLLSIKLSVFGILIPIHDDRSSRVFNSLKKTFPNLCEYPIEQLSLITKEDLLLAHNDDFVQRLLDSELCEREVIKAYELIDSAGNPHRYDKGQAQGPLGEMISLVLRQASATRKSMEVCLRDGFCFYLGGGMHHAMSFGGRGFCPINDIVIGIRSLQKKKKLKNAWVVDVDAHKGDGTAEITQEDSSILTLSIHMKKGWPLDGPSMVKGVLQPCFLSSDVDIEIDRNEEGQYLKRLQRGLFELEEKSDQMPELVVVVAGADPYEKDELLSTNKLNLSKEEMLARDMLLYHFFKERGISQCWLMAGGYGKHSHEIYTQFLVKVLHLMGENTL